MSWFKQRSWDNRDVALSKDCINDRTWSRRVQWLNGEDRVKLKFEDTTVNPHEYREALFDQAGAAVAWARFKEGQPTNDCISILGNVVPASMQSRRATETITPTRAAGLLARPGEGIEEAMERVERNDQ